MAKISGVRSFRIGTRYYPVADAAEVDPGGDTRSEAVESMTDGPQYYTSRKRPAIVTVTILDASYNTMKLLGEVSDQTAVLVGESTTYTCPHAWQQGELVADLAAGNIRATFQAAECKQTAT